MLRRWFHIFRREDGAQDLVEYTLLLGFVALAAIGIMSQAGVSVQGPWTTAQTTLEKAAPVAAPATPPPGGGVHDDRDHDKH
jgi:Flp pilus assembly pilin Flp